MTVKYIIENNELPNAILVDLDGCLLNFNDIKKYLPQKGDDRQAWDEYYTHYNECTPHQWCVNLVKKYSETHTILFITSREARGDSIKYTLDSINTAFGTLLNKDYLKSTEEDSIWFLQKYDFKKGMHLLMRKDSDYRHSQDIKRELYNQCVQDRYIIEWAIDDEEKNLLMWNELGIWGLRPYEPKEVTNG